MSANPKIRIAVAAIIALIAVSAVYYYLNYFNKEKPTTDDTIKVALMTWGGSGPGFVGIEKGFFDDVNVEISIIDDSAARQSAFQSEQFDILLTNPDQHPRERLDMNLPGAMILLSDISNGADGVLAQQDINSISDLSGKEVVYVRGAASDYMISKALESAGLSRDDVKLTSVEDPSISVASIKQGDIAAAVSWEPLMSQSVSNGDAKILFTSADVPDSIIGVFVAKDRITGNPKLLDAFLSGWIQSVEYTLENQDEANKIMADAFGVKIEEMAGMIEGIRLADMEMNKEWFSQKEGSLTTRIDKFALGAAEYWKSVGLLESKFDPGTQWVAPEAAGWYFRQ